MDEFMAAMFLPHTDGRAFPETMKALEKEQVIGHR